MNKEEKRELENFLYPEADGLVQRVYAKRDKTVLLWAPGKENESGESYLSNLERTKGADLLGYTGKVFRNGTLFMNENENYRLFWIGIDIDDIEINEDFYSKTLPTIRKIVPYASIRVSTGGHGIHIIHRVHPFLTFGNCSRSVRDCQLNWALQLEEIGLNVCKYDNRTFFLLGGKNKWILKNNEKIDIRTLTKFAPTRDIYHPDRKQKIEKGFVSPKILSFLKGLKAKGCRIKGMEKENSFIPSIQGIWIKEIKETIEKMRAEKKGVHKFVTKSPCKSKEWECNGWIIVTPNFLSIRGFADDENCFEILDLDHET